MVEALKNGDSVVTRGGIVGSVQSVKNDTLTIRSLESKLRSTKTRWNASSQTVAI